MREKKKNIIITPSETFPSKDKYKGFELELSNKPKKKKIM